MRADTWPEGDDVYPGSDPAARAEQLLDEYGVDYAVLNCADLMICHEVPELAPTSHARSTTGSGRSGSTSTRASSASIVVPHESPDARGREIERLRGRRALGAGDPPDEHRGAARQPEVPADLPRRGRARAPGRDPHSAATTRTAAPAGRRTTSRSTSATRSRCRCQLLNMVCEGVFSERPGAEGRPQRVRRRCGQIVARAGRSTRPGRCCATRSRDLDRKPSEVHRTTTSGSRRSRSRSRTTRSRLPAGVEQGAAGRPAALLDRLPALGLRLARSGPAALARRRTCGTRIMARTPARSTACRSPERA